MKWVGPSIGRGHQLFCHPLSLDHLREGVETLSVPGLAGLSIEVLPKPYCPRDEAWLTDGKGGLTRLVWGERHSKSMAICGPRGLDANGSPVEAV